MGAVVDFVKHVLVLRVGIMSSVNGSFVWIMVMVLSVSLIMGLVMGLSLSLLVIVS